MTKDKLQIAVDNIYEVRHHLNGIIESCTTDTEAENNSKCHLGNFTHSFQLDINRIDKALAVINQKGKLRTVDNYTNDCLRTENVDGVESRLDHKHKRLLHCALGVTTEAAEFADLVKKYLFYGKEYDQTHALKELGDILWYIAVATNALGSTLDEVMYMNIEKLKARYPEKYSDESAINRKEGDI